MTVQIYIGSNNDTNKLETERIAAIVSSNHDGFTIYEALGYWLGKPEATAVVIVSDDKAKIEATISELKIALNQDAIAYQILPGLRFA